MQRGTVCPSYIETVLCIETGMVRPQPPRGYVSPAPVFTLSDRKDRVRLGNA